MSLWDTNVETTSNVEDCDAAQNKGVQPGEVTKVKESVFEPQKSCKILGKEIGTHSVLFH